MKFKALIAGTVCCGILGVSMWLDGSGATEDDRTAAKKIIESLQPLHKTIDQPRPGDWLDRHEEPGQTFTQYIRGKPVRPTRKRRILYVQPIGVFSSDQQKILKLTAEFMGLYFDTPVKTLETLPLSQIPDSARRVHAAWGDEQILTSYVLDQVLYPELPDDAFAMIALTSSDLWPGKGWNFVFGQASLRKRVGVWSIYRNGDPSTGDEQFKLCLSGTLKTATHETGHMLSMQHCIYYECNMCGANHRGESDRRPLYLCPICTAKLIWATRTDAAERAKKLESFCRRHNLDTEADYYQKSLDILSGKE